MPEPEKKTDLIADAKRVGRIARWAAVVGFALAVICHALPPTWQPPCNAVAKLCRGGL